MNTSSQDNTTNRWALGPGVLVTAAFIGPGTITACSLAGANYGHALIWALLFSVVACYILQEMSLRLGVVTRQGLGEALAQRVQNRWLKLPLMLLVVLAILIGNSAYEGGNLGGAIAGLQALTGTGEGAGGSTLGWSCGLGLLAYLLLMQPSYRLIERILVLLVMVMSLAFVITFVLSRPDFSAILSGLRPRMPDGATLSVVALIGTTVVPYNLFLHASAVSQRWRKEQLGAARRDAAFSIGLGGLVSITVLSTAAAVFFRQGIELTSVAAMSQQLQPLLGQAAVYGFGVGLFAAGLTSAMTAPLAAAYAVCGLFGWPADNRHWRFRLLWIVVLLCGVTLAGLGIRPLSVIWFAQVANGLLLPLMALFLLYVMNSSSLLGRHVNNRWQNGAGLVVIAVCLLLGGKSLMLAWQQLGGGG